MTENEVTNRIKNALILIKSGHPMKVGDLTLSNQNKNDFSVIGWTNTIDLKNVTKDSAIKELSDIKNMFNEMLSISEDLLQFVKMKKITYSLVFDYGSGGIGICEEENDQIKWLIELKN